MKESRLIGFATSQQYAAKRAANGPIVQPAQTAQATSYSPTELKAISGGADPNATDQNGNLLMGTTTTPTTPVRPTATIQDTGPTGPYNNVQEATDAQNAYYIQHGSRDQGIDANIVNLQNRLNHLQNGGDSLPSGVQDPILRAQLAAANAAEAKSIQDQLANIQKAKTTAAQSAPTGAENSAATSTNPLLAAATIRGQARLKGQPIDAAGVQTALHPGQAPITTNSGPTGSAPPQTDTTTPTSTPTVPGQTSGATGASTPSATPNSAPGQTGSSLGTTTPDQTGTATATADPFITSISSIIGPELTTGIQDVLNSATTQKANILAAVAQGKIDQQTAITGLAQIRDDTIKAALDHYSDQLDFNAKQDTLEKTTVENAKADQQDIVKLQQQQADLNNHIAYHNQEVQNTETEMQNRNAAAKMGINFDTGGLKWMQTQQQKGVDALNFISEQMAISSATFAADSMKIVRDYTQNTMQASQDAQQRYNDAWKSFNDSKRGALTDYSTGAMNQRQYYAGLNEKYASDVQGIDKNVGDTYGKLATDMKDSYVSLNRIQFDRQQASMSNVKDIWTATGGQDSPALEAAVKAAKDAGVSADRLAGYTTGQLTMTGVKNSFEAKGYNYLNPDTWADQPSKDIMSLLRGVTFTSPDKMLSAAGDVGDILAQGNIDQARNKVINYAVSTLPADTQKSVQTGLNIERQVGALQSFIDQNQDALKNTGIYERKGQELLNFVNKSQDPVLRKFYGLITKINATEMHDLYGARLTETEIGFGKDFLAQTNEPLQNVIGKLGTLKSDIEGQNNQILGQALGTGSAFLSGDNGGTQEQKTKTSPSTDDWMNNYQQYIGKPQASLPRTDRNNNPTAMTTDAAKSMGLKEGKDFIVGDAFPPNEGGNNMHTAKFTGNPIDTTIKAIDQGGLFTKGGSPRWTYLNKLGITQDGWNGMDKREKTQTIEKMYKMEGGSGVLFNTMS